MARAYLTLSYHAGYCGALSIHLGLSVKLQALVVSFVSVGLSVNSITNCSMIAHHRDPIYGGNVCSATVRALMETLRKHDVTPNSQSLMQALEEVLFWSAAAAAVGTAVDDGAAAAASSSAAVAANPAVPSYAAAFDPAYPCSAC